MSSADDQAFYRKDRDALMQRIRLEQIQEAHDHQHYKPGDVKIRTFGHVMEINSVVLPPLVFVYHHIAMTRRGIAWCFEIAVMWMRFIPLYLFGNKR